ncbi:MAG: DUF3006 domain-containing protein [Oscillospiraceae bacterium]
MIIVDRIENGTAVVYFDRERRDIPLVELPEGVHEGSVLRETESGLVPDTEAENERRKKLAERTKRLFGR